MRRISEIKAKKLAKIRTEIQDLVVERRRLSSFAKMHEQSLKKEMREVEEREHIITKTYDNIDKIDWKIKNLRKHKIVVTQS